MMKDTIAAQATPSGRGGVGIIRISGPKTSTIAKKILGRLPKPRYAEYHPFREKDGTVIDEGIVLFFPSPHSFTGEDVLELQGHGGAIVMDRLLQRVLQAGARIANPGEFSQRAFLNDKLDLTQAEAIADLIDASSEEAARAAMRSLQGEFSNKIKTLVEALIDLRKHTEAAIDFPEEEMDFLQDERLTIQLQTIVDQLEQVEKTAQQGTLLREGMTIVIAGEPNVGKSSLLNQLSGREAAIVTPIAGTTRDTLREYINLDGMPLHFIDTAGLRETEDSIEQEGIRRAWQEIASADMVLLVIDGSHPPMIDPIVAFSQKMPKKIPITLIKNKIDLVDEQPKRQRCREYELVQLSAKTGEGLDVLKDYLKEYMGYNKTKENTFIARRRHLHAIARAKAALKKGMQQLLQRQGELFAEELRLAQQALSEITGEFTSDDLLGEIFLSFCIGK